MTWREQFDATIAEAVREDSIKRIPNFIAKGIPREEIFKIGFKEDEYEEALETMDKERIAIANALGLEQRTVCQEYIDMYSCGVPGTPLYQLCRDNKGYEGIMCAKTLNTRYVTEDIPYSLVALRALAQVVGVPTPCMDAIISIGYAVMDNMDEGRTAKNLGIEGMTKEELLKYCIG